MSAELRGYAEAIIGCVTKSDTEHGRQYDRDTSKFGFGLMEPYELAVVYLAEHPADSDEPITREWLESVGFTAGHDSAYTRNGLSLQDWGDSSGADWRWQVGGEDNFWETLNPPTRGAVLTALRLLGVPTDLILAALKGE